MQDGPAYNQCVTKIIVLHIGTGIQQSDWENHKCWTFKRQ